MTDPRHDWIEYVRSMGSVMGEAEHIAQRMADRIEQLEADMRRLEQIYNRDQVAQVFANEIETIFDRTREFDNGESK